MLLYYVDENNPMLEYIHLQFLLSCKNFVRVYRNKSYTTFQFCSRDSSYPANKEFRLELVFWNF